MQYKILLASLLLAMAGSHAGAQGPVPLNVICSAPAEWCRLVSAVYTRTGAARVNVSVRGPGEALAQLVAEKENPKMDVWFGGSGDPHLQAAQQGLTAEYKSALLPQLHPWARKQAEDARYRTVGIYLGPLGFGYNTELLARRKVAAPQSWADLLRPEFKGEIQMASPASSGTAYIVVATLVQLMGEEKAFSYLKSLHGNVATYTRSGVGSAKAAARGEALVSISFVHDVVAEATQGFPLASSTPSEGTGAEIGSMSIVKGSRNIEAAKAFYDWALTPDAQRFGAAGKSFHMPSNAATPVDPRVPDIRKIKLIDYDYANYGSIAQRRRLISRWEKEVSVIAR